MKNGEKNTDCPSSAGVGRYRKEWAVAVFSLLMATALPALAAMVAGISVRSGTDGLTEQTTVCLCRHDTEVREELTFGRILALSLAATNASDTPAASLEAQAILLRSRGVWWMNYCGSVEEKSSNWDEFSGNREEDGSRREDASANVASDGGKSDRNGAPVEESGRKGQKVAEKGDGAPIVLCDSPVHGLPYLSYDELVSLWGESETDARIAAAQQAVKVTRGQVLCYEGEVVPAILHHSSGGVTRSVERLPWLAAVATPEVGSESVCTYSAEEARNALAAGFGLLLPADPLQWELTLQSDAEGRAEWVTVAGERLPGTAFAEALRLPSVAFSVQVSNDTLIFTCTGAGSGCGLSRAGAAIYAAGGLTCGEILAHYYPDCTVGVMGG
ncbi:MAG: hypothetical protein IJW98_00525 [Clostridia bacterium]|nr:hypothetical protein [Clostridia bacterium]